MENIKKIIIIIAIIIVILILIMLFIQFKNTTDDRKIDTEGDRGEEINYDDSQIEDVNDSIKFYTVRDCIYSYYDNINTLNNINAKPIINSNEVSNEQNYEINEGAFDDIDADNLNEENSNINIEDVEQTDAQIKQNILDLLSSDYIKENNITINNLQNHIENKQQYIWYEPLRMKVLDKSRRSDYLVYGFITDPDNNFLGYKYLVVSLDGENGTFSVEPLNKQYNNIDEIELINNNDEIKQNNNNQYSNLPINYEYLITQYVKLYKLMFMSNPELAYQYLDNEYKNKRFGNLEQYKKYINDNKSELSELEIDQYSIDESSNYTRYICKDTYNNYYIIKETNPMSFTLLLDAYTLEEENFKEEYSKANNQYKVMMNVDRWNQMLNCRDYSTAYNALDETFRNNNFGSEEKFKQYMRENLPSHYKIEYKEFNNQNNTYIQEITLNDIEEESEGKNISIIMQLKEDRNFVMSFSIN